MNTNNSLLVWYRTNEGSRTALLWKVGRRWAQIVTMDSYPLRVHKVRVAELQHMSVMPDRIDKALRVYQRLAKRDHGEVSNWPKNLQDALR